MSSLRDASGISTSAQPSSNGQAGKVVLTASGAIALPSVFTFDKTGLVNMVKLATVPALLAVFAYLKSSPVPALGADRDS